MRKDQGRQQGRREPQGASAPAVKCMTFPNTAGCWKISRTRQLCRARRATAS